jgi:hypothetical protein
MYCFMKLFGIYLTNRKYLLPLILTVSVFFISHGISVPNFSNPQEAKLSNPQEAKPRACGIATAKNKSPQSRIVKTAQFFALCSNFNVYNKPTFHILAFNYESDTSISVLNSSIPARAPPA